MLFIECIWLRNCFYGRQVHHHCRKFIGLESALRRISLCCIWIRDAFQSCFFRNKLFSHVVTSKIWFCFLGTSSCDQVCNVCICTRRHISGGGRHVIQNNFVHSLTTKFVWLNDQWQCYMQDDDPGRNTIKMPRVGKQKL